MFSVSKEAVGTTDFALGNLETLITSCRNEVASNNTNIVEVNPSDPNHVKLNVKPISNQAEELLKKLCPGACSMKGTCRNGRCQCQSGFGGEDCSIDLNAPPTNLVLLNNGLCDLQKRRCLSTIVFGEDISTIRRVNCVINEYVFDDFSGHQDRKRKTASYNVQATVMSSGQVECALRRTLQGRPIYLYEIALNNGGTTSESEKMIVFDSNCYSVSTARRPIVKDNVCIINSTCFLDGVVNPAGNGTQACNAGNDQFSWSTPAVEITNRLQCFRLPSDSQRLACMSRFINNSGR